MMRGQKEIMERLCGMTESSTNEPEVNVAMRLSQKDGEVGLEAGLQ